MVSHLLITKTRGSQPINIFWKISHDHLAVARDIGKPSLNVVFSRHVQINLLSVKKQYSFECQVVQYRLWPFEDKYFTIWKLDSMTSPRSNIRRNVDYTRVVHSITFKLTDFVWELSTVLHVELDLAEDIAITHKSYKFLPMWRKKRTKWCWGKVLYPWRPYLEILNVIG